MAGTRRFDSYLATAVLGYLKQYILRDNQKIAAINCEILTYKNYGRSQASQRSYGRSLWSGRKDLALAPNYENSKRTIYAMDNPRSLGWDWICGFILDYDSVYWAFFWMVASRLTLA
jgi:hypothetical protein